MGLVNQLEGNNQALFQGIANKKNYFEVKILDSTTFLNTDVRRKFSDNTSYPNGFTTSGIKTFSNGRYVYRVDPHVDSLSVKSGFKGFQIDSTSDFDFRFRFNEMNVPNEYGDGTCAIVFGMIFSNDFTKNGGGFYGRVDSPANGVRRFTVFYARLGLSSSNDVTIFTKTESIAGEFGPSSLSVGHISGKVIQSIRFCRSGNRLLAEWNYWSDQTISTIGVDSTDSFVKVYRNKCEFYPDNGYNSNNGSPFIFNSHVFPQVYARFNSIARTAGGIDFTALVSVTHIESIPAVCLDTTNMSESVDVLYYSGNILKFQNRGHAEGFSDIRITQFPDNSNVSISTNAGDIIEFSRNEVMSGHTHQFLYDNVLSLVKTNDLQRDIYIDKVLKDYRNLGNIFPKFSTTLERSRLDGTYFIYVNKDGIIDELKTNNDSTEYSLSIDPTNTLRGINNINLGKNNLPTFLFYDETNYIGRTARFSILENIKVEYQIGQTAITDQYKICEKDSTSYYILEVISDGTYFITYSRIYNLITKTLGNRSRINTDITIYNKNPTYSSSGTQYPGLTFRYYKPNPDILVFPDKHVCAITSDAFGASPFNSTPGFGFRLFYESFDQGATWVFRDNSTRNYGRAGEESYQGETHTFKIKGNDNYFFNFLTTGSTVVGQYVNKDTFSTKPSLSFYNNLLKYSKFPSDQTVKYIHGCYDPIQKNIKIILSSLNGFFEVLKSPKIQGDSIKGFENLYSDQGWQSEFYSTVFSGSSSGNVIGSVDSNGDLLAIGSKVNDSTSFAIFRTSLAKDDLNYMGRFLQGSNKISGRKDLFMTNMFQDYYGNIILSSASVDTTNVLISLQKYGQYSNEPNELDLDEGFIFPQQPTLAVSTASSDSTVAGWIFSGNGSVRMNSFNNVRSLENSYMRGGFRSEWRSFTDPVTTDITASALRMNFQILGRKITSTNFESIDIRIGWDTLNVWAYDGINNVKMDRNLLDGRLFRRYMFCGERTSDSSARFILFTENLNLSTYDKIIWDRKLSFVMPFTSSSNSDLLTITPGSLSQTIHMTHWHATRLNNPIHPQRKGKLSFVGEKITSRSIVSDKEEYNGISCNKEFSLKLTDKIFCDWDGLEGFKNDSWSFQLNSSSKIMNLIDKEPFKSFKSDSDTTSCVLELDATDQGLQFIRSDVAVFLNTNFRRCFVEGYTSSLLNSATTPIYSKELFFDIDSGVVVNDTTNYGTSTVLMCHGKNWRIDEHIDRYIQFESCRLDSTALRHTAFKIIDNGSNFLNIMTGSNRFDTTNGMRYFIYDNKMSLGLLDNTQYLNYWRIRIPENQSMNNETVTDETAQGKVYYERYREIGEFDIGKLTELSSDVDNNIDVNLVSDTKSITFDNLSSHNIEFARPRRNKRIRYSNGTNEDMLRIKKIFTDLQGSNKPFWLFEDQKNEPGIFIFGRIINELEFEEINDMIQSVTIEIEEIT